MLRKIIASVAQNAGKHKRIATITTNCINYEKIATANESNNNKQIEFPSYTIEESAKILQIINNKDLAELLNYEITKARANKLLTWQKSHGPLQNVQDILDVEGFSLKTVQKFYKSLLDKYSNNNNAANKEQQRTTKFVTPNIDVSQQQSIASCVSVRIGVSCVTWARLELSSVAEKTNDPCLLTHWQHHEISEKKLHLHELVQRCLYITHLIPSADCYLFENPQMAQTSTNPGSIDQQNINVQKAQIIAMLSYALSARKSTSLHHQEVDEEGTPQEENKAKTKHANVFYLRRFLAARLFNHLVGTERVSSEESVLKLMRIYYNTNMQEDFILDENENNAAPKESSDSINSRLSFRGNIQFPNDLRRMFARGERYQREFLGQTLLLNLAFVRLILLQDAASIAQVTRNTNKDVTTTTNVA